MTTTTPTLDTRLPGIRDQAHDLAARYWNQIGCLLFAGAMAAAYAIPRAAAIGGLRNDQPVWVTVAAVALVGVFLWAVTAFRAHVVDGRRPVGYRVAVVITVALLIASCLLLVVIVALILAGVFHP